MTPDIEIREIKYLTELVIFGDGVMSITVTDDPYGFNYDVLNGVYDQTKVTDFSKVG